MKRVLTAGGVVAVLIVGALLLVWNSRPSPPPPAKPAEATHSAPEQRKKEPDPGPDSVVFEMTYRPIDSADDPLSYRSSWGFGRSDEDDPFLQAVRRRVDECVPVYNGVLPHSAWAAVEVEEGEPVALYFDIDANGKVSADEKFLPARTAKQTNRQYTFFTSDFLIRREGKAFPFRLMLQGNRYGGNLSFMWSPSCVLDGEAPLAGQRMKLFLYADGPGGSFTEFRRSSFALLPAEEELPRYVPRHVLSSLIHQDGRFYRVRFLGSYADGDTLQAALTPDTSPTGQVVVEIVGTETLDAELSSAVIEGTTDETVHLRISGPHSTFPVGGYQLSSGQVRYGTAEESWSASISDGPPFTIEADRDSRLELGGPALAVRAIRQQDRYRTNAEERDTFGSGDTAYFEPRITGKGGEIFTRFSMRTDATGRRKDVEPHLTIVDSQGRQVVATDLEYG